jgi:NAD+ kinase
LPATSFAFVAADTEEAQRALQRLRALYGTTAPQDAATNIPLGGDGFMLETLHAYVDSGKVIYGMHCGTIGFLMNQYGETDLPARLAAAETVQLHPLAMRARTESGETAEAFAFNEVALLRQTRQAAKIAISIDGRVRLEELICDGVLLSTPAGSTAYNLSAHGPILPIGSGVLALTPISAFRPRRWRGALLPHIARVTFTIREPAKRPVSAVADFTEVRRVIEVEVHEDAERSVNLLFDPDHNLEERVLREQFTP